MGQLTELLNEMQSGNGDARDALFGLAYEDLRRLARKRLRDGGRNTVLDTTALVHEAYLRLSRVGELRAEDRRAFFAYASRVMRSVIVDSARERLAERRGGGQADVTLDTNLAEAYQGETMILNIHDALQELEKIDARAARVVEMRYFGGYSETEIAEALGITERTVQRDWKKAQMLLIVALG